MIRLAISVEGSTENEFVKVVLAEHLLEFDVFPTPVTVTTKRLVHAKNKKGGSISLDRATREVQRLLPSFDHVTTLYDFYGFIGKSSDQSVEDVETELLDRIRPSLSFTPYLQKHEFEAILFSGTLEMAVAMDQPHTDAALKKIVRECGEPEMINDNPNSAPSKRLADLYGPKFDKKFHGPMVASEIGIARIRQACPRFNTWISFLETLGQS